MNGKQAKKNLDGFSITPITPAAMMDLVKMGYFSGDCQHEKDDRKVDDGEIYCSACGMHLGFTPRRRMSNALKLVAELVGESEAYRLMRSPAKRQDKIADDWERIAWAVAKRFTLENGG